MTREDLIRMAGKAGLQTVIAKDEQALERFAALVADAEREAIIDIVALHGGSVEIEADIRARGQV